jgi:hypothetical protein
MQTNKYITEADLNDPKLKEKLLYFMNRLLEVGATCKRAHDNEWDDSALEDAHDNSINVTIDFYQTIKQIKPQTDVKVCVDSTDPAYGRDYIDCIICKTNAYISADRLLRCQCWVCNCGDKECDGGCGVQSCGSCIDVCRCRFGRDY